MNSQFKKGVLEVCILSLIDKKDMYGFEVIDTLAKAIEVNDNTVYPILRRLTTSGLFETYLESTGIAAPRKYYRITEKGKRELENYLLEWKHFIQGVYQIIGGNNE